jgi:hypothetical protein
MTYLQETTYSQHTMAAIHHDQAAKFHHAASTHFESGKDYAHSAHEAILAHGHALKALEFGQKAIGKSNSEDGHVPARQYQQPSHLLSELFEGAGLRAPCTNGAEHHRAAAVHHELAASHERQASSYESASNSAAAEKEALLAEQHSQLSLFHSDEAAKYLSL